MPKLEGKVARITGGVGESVERQGSFFVEERAHVTLVDLDESALQNALQSIGDKNATYVVADKTQLL